MLVVELEGGITPYIASWKSVINTWLTGSYSRWYKRYGRYLSFFFSFFFELESATCWCQRHRTTILRVYHLATTT